MEEAEETGVKKAARGGRMAGEVEERDHTPQEALPPFAV